MIIKAEDIGHVAEEILDIMRDRRIETAEDIWRRVVEDIKLNGSKGFLEFSMTSSGSWGGGAKTMSYFIDQAGIIFRAIINTEPLYSQIHLKCSEHIENYIGFSRDDFGNLIQKRFLMECGFQEVRTELRRLHHIC